ncbi:hypothetical protein PRIC2_011853 [Phytophthora ramorum]
MPTPSLSLGSIGVSSLWSSPGSALERSYSSSSLRASPKASPGRVPQKSFGRQPARVAAAPVSPNASPSFAATADESSSSTVSLNDAEFAQSFRQELARDLPTIQDEVDHEKEATDLRAELDALRKDLQDLRDASSKNDEAWQRENIRLKEQLTAANSREAAQQEQLCVGADQLALCRQELLDLQEHQLKVEDERATLVPPPIEDAGSSGLGRERDLLKLVVQLVGAPNVRAVLRENPNARPAQLREALVGLRCTQCRLLSPSPSLTKTTGSNADSLHKMLFGVVSRPASPTATRSSSTGARSPHL